MTDHRERATEAEDSLKSTGRSPAPARVMEAASSRRAAEEAARREKLYNKVMLLHYQLADEETKRAMEKPTGWRPVFPMNLSLETQIYILQGRLNAKKP